MNEDNHTSPQDWQQGHRDRLRKRFLQAGLESFQNYEQLELLLTFVIPRKDVKPIAKQLLKEFKSLAGVLDAPVEALTAVPGVGENSAILLKVVREFGTLYLEEEMQKTDLVCKPDRAVNFARSKLGGLNVEAMLAIYVNIKNYVITSDVSYGTVDQATIYPRNIMEKMLRFGAAGVVLVHNHPSGICQPSQEDIALTRSIQQGCKTIGLKLVDHIVVSRSTYFSFIENGIL